jgi:hypothetical protein
LLGSNSPLQLPGASTFPPTSGTQDFSLLKPLAPVGSLVNPSSTGSLVFGLEPNVQNDEQGDYITHLQRLRRVNLGDDNSDSAGYGLYMMRVPVSITPGDDTKRGFGAAVDLTIRHDFGPRFLPTTYRNLVINDLIDRLSPVIYEMIRSGLANRFYAQLSQYSTRGTSPTQNRPVPNQANSLQEAGTRVFQSNPTLKQETLETVTKFAGTRAVNRSEPRSYPVAPDDLNRVFGGTVNILVLAYGTQIALDVVPHGRPPAANTQLAVDFNKVRLVDVRSFLKQELETAYNLMEGRCPQDGPAILADVPYIEDITDKVFCRQ